MNEFVRNWDDGYLESRPDPSSQLQVTIIEKLVAALNIYKNSTRFYQNQLGAVREEAKEAATRVSESGHVEFEEINEEVEALLTRIGTVELRDAELRRFTAALQLESWIDKAKGQWLLYPTEGVLKKLKECMEERQRLSSQIADYKQKRISELSKDSTKRNA
jgi:hypothetical protein